MYLKFWVCMINWSPTTWLYRVFHKKQAPKAKLSHRGNFHRNSMKLRIYVNWTFIYNVSKYHENRVTWEGVTAFFLEWFIFMPCIFLKHNAEVYECAFNCMHINVPDHLSHYNFQVRRWSWPCWHTLWTEYTDVK